MRADCLLRLNRKKKQYKKIAIRILSAVIFVAISVMGGWQLTYVIDMLPFNMPGSRSKMFIRLCLSITANDDLANSDDMEVLALIFYWALSALLVGALLYAGVRGLRRLRVRKNSQKLS